MFVADCVECYCGEQFFAAAEAHLLATLNALKRTLLIADPIKRFGRQEKGFDEAVSERERENVVRVASDYKFPQNPAG